MSGLRGPTGAVPPPDTTPSGAPTERTPLQQAIGRAITLNMTVVITDAEQNEVRLSGADLVRAGRMDAEEFRSTYGTIDQSDLTAAINDAAGRNTRGAEVNLSQTNSANAALYNRTDGDYVSTRPDTRAADGHAKVTIGTEGAFDISGRAVDADEYTGWDKFLDILVEVLATIFTLGLARVIDALNPNTRWEEGTIDEQRWKNAAGTIALAGGSGLRELLGRPDAEERLTGIVRRSNPDIPVAQARNIARALAAELQTIYSRVDGTPPDGKGDARLDNLRRAFANEGAFGADPGAWLQAQLASTQALPERLAGAANRHQVEAMLALNVPEFVDLDSVSQTQTATLLHTALTGGRSDGGEVTAAFQQLINNEGFQRLPPTVRRGLLTAIENQGITPGSVRNSSDVASVLDRLNPPAGASQEDRATALRTQTLAAEILGSIPPGPAFQAARDLIARPGFLALDPSIQRAALNAIRDSGYNAETIGDVGRLIDNNNYQRLAGSGGGADLESARGLVAAVAAGRSAAVRQGFIDLVDAPGFAALTPSQRREASAAMSAVTGPTPESRATRRQNLLNLINSRGFQALSDDHQSALLARFTRGVGGTPPVQESFSAMPATLDAMLKPDGSLALSGDSLAAIINDLTTGSAAELPARMASLTRVLPELGRSTLSAGDQGLVLTALRAGGFSTARTDALVGPAGGTMPTDPPPLLRSPAFTRQEGLPRLHNDTRTELLRAMSTQTDDARFGALVGLATDADLGRLGRSNERRVVRMATDRLSASGARGRDGVRFVREMRRLIGQAEFRSPGSENLRGDARAQWQGMILDTINSPDVRSDALVTMRNLMRAPSFDRLRAEDQFTLLDHTAGRPSEGAHYGAMLAGYVALPAARRSDYIIAMVQLDLTGANAATLARNLNNIGVNLHHLPSAARDYVMGRLTTGGSDPTLINAIGARMAEPSFHALGNHAQAADIYGRYLRALNVSGVNGLLNHADFTALAPAAQRAVLRGILNAPAASRGAVTASMQQLVTFRSFKNLTAAQQLAIVSQARNFPNTTSIADLRRLTAATWLTNAGSPAISSGLAHIQRSAAMVASNAAYVHSLNNKSGPTAGERRAAQIMRNTMDQFLPTIAADGTVTQGRFRVNWKTYARATVYGSAAAGSGVLDLNAARLPASNGPPPTNAGTRRVLRHTTPHEVNHLLNGDRVRQSFEYLMGEYGAWYVGFRSEHRRDPTAAEAYAKLVSILRSTSGAYNRLRMALHATDASGRPTAEATKMIGFLQSFFNPPAPATASALVPTPPTAAPVPNRTGLTTGPTPPASEGRNMDNSGAPRATLRGAGVPYDEGGPNSHHDH